MLLDWSGEIYNWYKTNNYFDNLVWKNDIVSEIKTGVIETLMHHTLATDFRKNLPFNLDNLRTRSGLLHDLKDKDNLLYEWKDWAVSTTIWPYWNHHIMLIYTGLSQEICHLWQVPDNQMWEYYEILSQLLEGLENAYKSSIENGELNLYYWLNHSLFPGGGKSQSVFRPHTHIVFIENQEKQEEFHIIEKLPISDWEKCNRAKLALNRQNLALIKNFEQSFLDMDLLKYSQSLIIADDEYYAIDIPLPGKISDKKSIEIFEKIHWDWRAFLEAIHSMDKNYVFPEIYDVLWDDLNKIWFSIWFHEIKWITHIRFRFSFKNPWENAWMLEAMWHAINRDEKMWDILPDMSQIRNLVKQILSNN